MKTNSRIWLEPSMRGQFKLYAMGKIHGMETRGLNSRYIKNDWEKIDAFFDYCVMRKTWADFSGMCVVAGEIKCFSTNKIFCIGGGRTIASRQSIIDFEAEEYLSDRASWISQNIFHNIFCDFEWLTRGKSDYAEKEYRKVFGKWVQP